VRRRGARNHFALAAALLALCSCSGNHDALARGQRYYEDNQFERALAIWRDLERHAPSFHPEESVRYAYLRGMTDYRLGFRDEARHWLGLATARERRWPGSIDPDWSSRLASALGDLDRDVFGIPASPSDPVQSIEAPLPPAASSQAAGAPELPRPLSPPPSPPSATQTPRAGASSAGAAGAPARLADPGTPRTSPAQ